VAVKRRSFVSSSASYLPVLHPLTCSKEAQTWGGGRAIVSENNRKEIKRAKKEGRLAEAMLDRRAALKR
jgi:hypothetical protein